MPPIFGLLRNPLIILCWFHISWMRNLKWNEVAQSCPTLCNPWTVTYQAPLSMGFSRHEYWKWVAISFSRGSSQPRDRTQVSRLVGRCFTVWATREALGSNLVAFTCQQITSTTPSVGGNKSYALKTEYSRYRKQASTILKNIPLRCLLQNWKFIRYHPWPPNISSSYVTQPSPGRWGKLAC